MQNGIPSTRPKKITLDRFAYRAAWIDRNLVSRFLSTVSPERSRGAVDGSYSKSNFWRRGLVLHTLRAIPEDHSDVPLVDLRKSYRFVAVLNRLSILTVSLHWRGAA